MILSFREFRFDCKQQILSKDGKHIQLNEKSAQLLSLFLSESHKIHSKADILEKVWHDRVVTEQVVFQNISQLRALLGDDAIKTFSKKGYQWQLPLQQLPNDPQTNSLIDAPLNSSFDNNDLSYVKPAVAESGDSDVNQAMSASETKTTFKSNSNPKTAAILIVGIGALMFVISMFMTEKMKTQDVIVEQNIQPIFELRFASQQLHRQVLESSTNQSLFDSPYVTWQNYASDDRAVLLAKRNYTTTSGVLLRYALQGERRGWSGYILADNKNTVEDKLEKLLQALLATNYFTVPTDHTALAELTILSHQYPDNLQLKHQLIQLSFDSNELDRANALVDQQLAIESNEIRRGLLFLLKTRITSWNQSHAAARNSVIKAMAIFQNYQLAHLEALALIQMGWVHLVDEEFRLGMQVLNQAASKARNSREPLLEVTAHLNQSFMASKAGEVELSHTQLDLGRELIEFHNLGDEHRVRSLNIAEWVAESEQEKVAINQRILALPFTSQYDIYFYIAAEKVRHHFIRNQDWNSAQATIKPWQRQSFQTLSQAHIAFAKDEWSEGTHLVKNAYQLAQLNGHKVDALDAALLLLQNINAESNVDEAEYESFIQQNATNRWLDQNRFALQRLGFSDEN